MIFYIHGDFISDSHQPAIIKIGYSFIQRKFIFMTHTVHICGGDELLLDTPAKWIIFLYENERKLMITDSSGKFWSFSDFLEEINDMRDGIPRIRENINQCGNYEILTDERKGF